MKITIDMPYVSECTANECTYNVGSSCHARAITIGDGTHPGCDTSFMTGSHIHNDTHLAGVGACKISGCLHNDDFECMAAQVTVGYSGSDINCQTYTTP